MILQIRDSPNDILPWLGLLSLQNRGLIDTNINSNTSSNSKYLIYEKQKSIIKECIDHFKMIDNNTNSTSNNDTIYYMYQILLLLTRSYEPAKYRQLCDDVIASCPYNLSLWISKLKVSFITI